MLSIPTAYWHEVVSALEVGLSSLPRSLRLVVTGGEKILPARVRAWKSRVGEKVRLLNAYGPTEATIESTIHEITHDTHAAGEAGEVPIGRPLSNIRTYILDAFLQPVPVGVTGELFLAGACLARGYLNQPEMTARKFVADPFVPGEGVLMYRTGDQAKYRPDGTIQFVGRVDDQVKIRGFRIELGEVETILAEHPDVAEVSVVVRENSEHDRCLDAYVVPLEGRVLRPADIQDFARQRLLGAMRPRAVVVVESLPRTSSDKVDRDLLPEPSADYLVSAQPEHAAHDPLEMQLVLLWEKIFGRKGIGVRDNFFDLGGHSLLAVRMFSQVEKLTGKNLPLVTLFQAPTIEQLASLLRQEGWEPPWSSLVAIRPGGSKPPLYGVHGVGGNILEFSDLTKYLGPDQPLYGLQAQGLDGKKPLHTSVEEMAEYYIKEVREFQPEGPYHLAGSSFGGMVAYEMARRLVAAGERVGLVALFDTMAPGYPKFLPATTAWKRRVHGWRFRLDLHWSNIRVARGKEKWDYVWEKTERLGKEIRNQVKKRRKRIRNKIRRLFFPKGIKSVPKGGTEASEKYQAEPYSGKVTLFRATELPYGIVDDRTNGWGPLALGGVEVVDVPGHHGSIMREPRARTLAVKIMGALDAANAEASRGDNGGAQQLPVRRSLREAERQRSTHSH